MSKISHSNNRENFKKFYCEQLSSNEANKILINSFQATEQGKQLEYLLKKYGWKTDSSGDVRFYLVKDSSDNIALFFSLKCGIVFRRYEHEFLEDEELAFMQLLVDSIKANDTRSIDDYLKSGMFTEEKSKQLYNIAKTKVDYSSADNQAEYSVKECFSAIELHCFCRNNCYPYHEKIPLGFGIFWEIIVPLIIKINRLVGCKYLYLFAADNTENKKDDKRLINYYKNALKFSDMEELSVLKPAFDNNCKPLIQEISSLTSNQKDIWEAFSDIFSIN